MLVQTVIGYAWLVSGIDKLRSSTFLPGLSEELAEMSDETKYGWYRNFLENVAIPNSDLSGRLVTWGELLVGISLIAAAAFLILQGAAGRWTAPVSAIAAAALLAGIFMNVNFHLAEGYYHPFAGYGDGLDGSIDLDSLMPLTQLVLLAFNLAILMPTVTPWARGRLGGQ
jgi:uncharacterized membrane protein YphA (DoxX/SURF4 family)